MKKLNVVNVRIIVFIIEFVAMISELLVLILQKDPAIIFAVIFNIVAAVLFSIVVLSQAILLIARKLLTDELSIQNDNMAVQISYMTILCLIALYPIITTIFNINIRLTNTIIMLILYFILSIRDGAFIYFEKNE